MTLIWLATTAVLLAVVLAQLHAPWAPIPWLVCAALSLAYWSRSRPAPRQRGGLSWCSLRSAGGLALVLGVALVLRLHRIDELPLGPYVDEIQTLRNALALTSAPFDFFGATPLVDEGWVHTSNAYLYFDALILRLFGVSHFSMKLFSVVPGALTCVFFTLVCRTLLTPRAALAAGLLLAVGHWPVRLSRYGWDATFSVMAFAAALWLWLLARQRGAGGVVWACASGLVMGLGLYGYLAARVTAASLLAVVLVDWLSRRDRDSRERALAFVSGIAIAALPLVFAALEAPDTVWLRAAELSIFSQPDPISSLFDNLLGHLGMFHLSGGKYARDNVPGLPMLDGVSGLLMLVGLWVLVRRRWRDVGWVVLLSLVGNWLAGLLSVSQEGAPYVYRTAATMIPAFLMVGFGAQAVDGSGARRAVLPVLLSVAVAWNLYAYFGLEARNVLAARVMAYELRLLADEVRATEHPVFLVGADTLAKGQPLEGVEPDLRPPYFDRNPTFRFGTGYSLRAVELLSGRHQSPLPAPILLQIDDLARLRSKDPVVLLFRPGGAGEGAIRRRFPAAPLRFVGDVRGPPALGVVTLSGVD